MHLISLIITMILLLPYFLQPTLTWCVKHITHFKLGVFLSEEITIPYFDLDSDQINSTLSCWCVVSSQDDIYP
jgi:hypothetical protein